MQPVILDQLVPLVPIQRFLVLRDLPVLQDRPVLAVLIRLFQVRPVLPDLPD